MDRSEGLYIKIYKHKHMYHKTPRSRIRVRVFILQSQASINATLYNSICFDVSIHVMQFYLYWSRLHRVGRVAWATGSSLRRSKAYAIKSSTPVSWPRPETADIFKNIDIWLNSICLKISDILDMIFEPKNPRHQFYEILIYTYVYIYIWKIYICM